MSELRALLLHILALRQPDPADRDAMLEILRKDGWLPDRSPDLVEA